MTKRTLTAAVVGLGLAAATALPASAIKYGEPDANEHPYVGLMVAYTYEDLNHDGVKTDDEYLASWRCTGTLMDANTFLTAGHCTYEADAVAIWFGDDLQSVRAAKEYYTLEGAIDQSNPALDADAWSYEAFSHPQYDDNAFYLHDIGLVDQLQFAPDVNITEYGQLPEAGYWDEQIALNKSLRDSYTTVGYGLQWSTPDRGKSQPSDNSNARQTEALWVKLKAHGELIGYRQFNAGKDNTAYVVLTNNANTGGTCSGDSGGPTFIDNTNVVVGVTSFGVNATCSGTSGVYRLDRADDLAWLREYIDA